MASTINAKKGVSFVIPTRLKALAASGVLAGCLGAAALNGAFAAPAPDPAAAPAAPSPTATTAQSTAAAPAAKPRYGKGPHRRGWVTMAGGFVQPLATYLGISATDLETDLRNGQTLAQVGQAHGKSASDLKTFLTAQLKARLDQAVANKKITGQQETDMLNKASARFDKLINAKLTSLTGPERRGHGGIRIGDDIVPTIAKTLGMQPADVQTALNNGQTLTQIAQAHGKTASDLETAIIDALKPRLDKLMTTNFEQLRQQRQSKQHPAPTATP